MNLSFERLRIQNVLRMARWHDPQTSVPWTGADWSNAMCGEAGEAANVVKKLRRIETATVPTTAGAAGQLWHGQSGLLSEKQLLDKLGEELADTVIYADLVAHHYGVDLAESVARKFNLVSEAQNFPERLP